MSGNTNITTLIGDIMEYYDDDYPSDESLDAIKNWQLNQYIELMNFVKEIWKYPDWGWEESNHPEGGVLYTISTGGWSGNEDIINALQDNTMFWLTCWQSSRRGGHYEFHVRTLKDKI